MMAVCNCSILSATRPSTATSRPVTPPRSVVCRESSIRMLQQALQMGRTIRNERVPVDPVVIERLRSLWIRAAALDVGPTRRVSPEYQVDGDQKIRPLRWQRSKSFRWKSKRSIEPRQKLPPLSATLPEQRLGFLRIRPVFPAGAAAGFEAFGRSRAGAQPAVKLAAAVLRRRGPTAACAKRQCVKRQCRAGIYPTGYHRRVVRAWARDSSTPRNRRLQWRPADVTGAVAHAAGRVACLPTRCRRRRPHGSWSAPPFKRGLLGGAQYAARSSGVEFNLPHGRIRDEMEHRRARPRLDELWARRRDRGIRRVETACDVKGHAHLAHGAVPSWLDGLPADELRTEFETAYPRRDGALSRPRACLGCRQ